MPSVAFDVFLPEILPECIGVSDPLALNAVRNACFDFCRDSLVWHELQEPQEYTAGEAEYTLDAPSNAQIIMVTALVLDGNHTVYPTHLDDVVRVQPELLTSSGTVRAFMQVTPDTIRLLPVPDSAGTFVVSTAYAPKRLTNSTDAVLFNRYYETIKHGALWKLKSIPGQAWSDAAGAVNHERLFRAGVSRARNEQLRGSSRAELRAAPQPFI